MTLNIRRCREDEQTELLRIINSAAQRYQGVIPDNCWHEPYMTANELTAEIAAGVQFWGAEFDGVLMGIMGIQQVRDADLIRHAYVLPAVQGKGIGGGLLKGLCSRMSKPLLIGTWSAASWAIDFYVRHGFRLVGTEEARKLLKTYWTIPDRQIEASVVLKQG